MGLSITTGRASCTSIGNPPTTNPPVICVAEDRASCEPALRILAASLRRYCADIHAEFYCPNATPEFAAWMSGLPNISLNASALRGAWTKYDIKPVALQDMLDRGYHDVLWIDSDILITRDMSSLLRSLDPMTIMVTEEALCSSHADPDGLRARLWGLPVGRALPFLANTGIVRITAAHRTLLARWRELLESSTYRNAQAQPWDTRALHVMGDQEVLTALLASREFSDIPIRFLHRGADIIQFFGNSGYTVRERFRHLFSQTPIFVHSQGFRPWWPRADAGRGMGRRFKTLYNDLSPYTAHAQSYRNDLADASWLSAPSPLVSILRTLGFRRAPLIGMPLALAADCARLLRGKK